MGRFVEVLIVAMVVGLAFACQPPDCDNEDCGSCANACCEIEFKFSLGPDETMQTIASSLKAGGADQRYTFVNTSDMRSYKEPNGAKYLVQGMHTTLTNHYNDTMDMLVLSNSTTESIVRAFSISRIWGAYCDESQNYKNLVGFVKGLSQMFAQKIIHGCTKNTNV